MQQEIESQKLRLIEDKIIHLDRFEKISNNKNLSFSKIHALSTKYKIHKKKMNKINFLKLSKDEIVQIANSIIGQTSPANGNWIETRSKASTCKIYHSQCKPSSASKGHWKYDFFHTLRLDTLLEVCEESSHVLLLNYIYKSYALLNGADLLWLARFSGRKKSNEGEVIDIVIIRNDEGTFELVPYDKSRIERRKIEVRSW